MKIKSKKNIKKNRKHSRKNVRKNKRSRKNVGKYSRKNVMRGGVLSPYVIDLISRLTSNESEIMMMGGNNIGDFVERDNLEYELISASLNNQIPLIGICRGMQVINTYFGGSLKSIKNHVNVRHIVSNINISFEVNSYHDFALAKCPNMYEVLAMSEDNCIEAIKHKKLSWEGWMWHPERDNKIDKINNLE